MKLLRYIGYNLLNRNPNMELLIEIEDDVESAFNKGVAPSMQLFSKSDSVLDEGSGNLGFPTVFTGNLPVIYQPEFLSDPYFSNYTDWNFQEQDNWYEKNYNWSISEPIDMINNQNLMISDINFPERPNNNSFLNGGRYHEMKWEEEENTMQWTIQY